MKLANLIGDKTINTIKTICMSLKRILAKLLDTKLVSEYVFRGRGFTGFGRPRKFLELEKLVDEHFKNIGNEDHPCRSTMTLALKSLNQSEAIIVETGTSAWGTKSSLLFDSYVSNYGGRFLTVDIRPSAGLGLLAQSSNRTSFFCDNSIDFLGSLKNLNKRVDLFYLDSMDVNWTDPLESAVHGFHEFLIIYPYLKTFGGYLLIDDTPKDIRTFERYFEDPTLRTKFSNFINRYNFLPGKGGLVKEWLVKNRIGREIDHQYQLLWEF